MRLAALFLLILIPNVASAADLPFAYWDESAHDPAIPTFDDVLGFRPGERITRPEDAIRYLEALAQAAPERMRLVDYGRSWQGRRLVYAVIGMPEAIASLATLRADIARLSDPRGLDDATADALIARLPGTVWLSYGVHGNEISSTEAALLAAWHLLSADDARTRAILRGTLVFIDPMQNPDGRARFVHGFEQALGLEPQSDRQAAEHDEPWPGGRTNQYLFDLNRDWLRVSQPETKGRIRVLRDWKPLVMVDAHEMSGDQSYFFAPEAVPYNPLLTRSQKETLVLFGRNHGRWFDRFGIPYFTREIYDAFYPGYGASWPSYYGGIAMTYEQGSSRGLIWRRRDGSDLHYADAIRNHLITSLSTAEVVATNRERLWRDYLGYRRSAIVEGGRGDIRSYILPTQRNRAGTEELARLLAFHGIEVGRANAAFRACGNDFEAGSFIVTLAQPEGRRARVLLDPEVQMDKDFIAAQEERRARGLPDEIYDVTAWSLPKMFGVETIGCRDTPSVAREMLDGEETLTGTLKGPEDAVAWLAPSGDMSAIRLMSAALRAGISLRSADADFMLEGKRWPAGTLIFERGANDPGLADRLAQLAAETGAMIEGVATSWVTEGPSFGSGRTPHHVLPRIAMAWDEPVSSYNAGNSRYVVERRIGLPVTPIRTARLARADLRNYDVLILPAQSGGPSGGYADVLGKAGLETLRDFVRDGGVLIALGSATALLADPEVDLLAVRREDGIRTTELPKTEAIKDDKDGERATRPGLTIADAGTYEALIAPERTPPDSIPGAIVKAEVDHMHWFAAGLPRFLSVLVSGNGIYSPTPRDEGANVVRFASADDLVESGHLWAESRKQLAYKPLVVIENEGAGLVIAITQETTTRAYQDGLDLLLANAILRGSQHSRRLR